MGYSDGEKLDIFLDYLGIPAQKRERLTAKYAEEELVSLLKSESAKLAPFLGAQAADLRKAKSGFAEFLRGLDARGIFAVTRRSPAYPANLLEISSPPFVLYGIGDLSLLATRRLAIVGRRACRRKSLEMTERFAGELAAAGLTVVSGLADGCDAAAHRGALAAGGKTIAVLAGGFDHVYPQSNLGLFREICRTGLVLSENPPAYRAQRHDFLLRNRIVSGISEGVLVTCAAERSGTLSTANAALEAGRELFAIPGDIDAEDCVGTNRLIKELQGALVTCPEDILFALGMESREKPPSLPEEPPGEDENSILRVLRDGELHINEIATALGMEYAGLSALLSVMEIKGQIERLPGNAYRVKIWKTGKDRRE